MENTEKSAAQWQEIVSEKDKEIAELRKQVDWFKGQFKLLQSKQFGPSSEKSVEAVAYSIVETAKANGLRPFRYFQFLLERLPVGTSADDCVPWNDAAQELCR